MNILNNLIKLCSTAKRTALLAQDNLTNEWYHIYSVIEILPSDIQDYNIPNASWYDGKLVRSKLSSKSDVYSFYLVITTFETIEEAVTLFNNPIQNNNIDGHLNLYFNSIFVKEPNGNYPLVLPSNIYHNDGLAAVLPKRNSGLLVWSQIDNERKVETLFRSDTISKGMKAMNQLTNDWLGFEIWAKPEHLGNIYLSIPNPYFRDVDFTLSNNPTGIFYHFKMRRGINENLKIRIIDAHGDNLALDKVYETKSNVGLIQLPHEPHSVEHRFYNSDDDLIAIHGPYSFLKSIQLNLQMKQADFNVKFVSGEEGFTVEKFSGDKKSVVGTNSDFNSAYYFKKAEDSRKHINLEENKEFIFFKGTKPGKEKTELKERARKIIQEIINSAKETCYLCDPYFKAQDLVDFAYKIKDTGVKLRILNRQGSGYVDKDLAKDLLEKIEEYNNLPFQKIECKMLKENLLHDRFIIADTSVWFLGTSFNEFGNKATCIGKVPESANFEIVKQIEKWYNDDTSSQTIQEYINSN